MNLPIVLTRDNAGEVPSGFEMYRPGSLVVYQPSAGEQWRGYQGSYDDPSPHLTEGTAYYVSEVLINAFDTHIWLENIERGPHGFNSVMFQEPD